MSAQTPRPARGPPRRHPSIEFRASPLRSASRASPTTPAPNHSTRPTTVLGHWRPRLTHEDRRYSSELCKKIEVILGESLDDDSTPRPVQIEAMAALFELDQFGSRDRYDAVFVTAPTGSGGSAIFEAMHLIYGRRAVTIVVSPLNALSNHQAANLNRQGKKAVVVSEETWRDGELYRQLDDRNHTISFILISPEMHIKNADWAKLISNESFRERVKLLVYDEAIKIAKWGLAGGADRAGSMSHTIEGSTAFRPVYGQVAERRLTLGCQTLFLTAGAPPYKIDRILKVSSLARSRTFFAKADLFRPNLRNIVVEMKPRTKGAMGSIRDLLDKRPDPSTFPQSILYFNSRIETADALLALHEQFGLPITVDSPLARKFNAVRGELDKSEDIKDFEKGSFPFFSTTSALGLGIHWPGVRTVTQYGRTTVEDDIQRKGRGGRSGQRSIGITFLEPRKDARKKSAASNPEQDDTIPDEISTSGVHGDRPRLELLTENELSIRFFYESKACLHALAIILYTQGELPLKADDPLIVAEMERQVNITGRSCQCSRCDPQGAKYIIEHLRYITEEKYHEFSSYEGAAIAADKMSQPTQNSQVENAEDGLEDSADERATQSITRQTRGHNPWRMKSQQRDEFVEKLLLEYMHIVRD